MGVIGVSPSEAWAMSPADAVEAVREHRKWHREMRRDAWARTLRLTGMWGDTLTVEEVFGEPSRAREDLDARWRRALWLHFCRMEASRPLSAKDAEKLEQEFGVRSTVGRDYESLGRPGEAPDVALEEKERQDYEMMKEELVPGYEAEL